MLLVVPFSFVTVFFWGSNSLVLASMLLMISGIIAQSLSLLIKPVGSVSDQEKRQILSEVFINHSFLEDDVKGKEALYSFNQEVPSLREQITEESKEFDPRSVLEEEYEDAANLIVKNKQEFILQVLKSNCSYDLKLKILTKLDKNTQKLILSPVNNMDLITILAEDKSCKLESLYENFLKNNSFLAVVVSNLKQEFSDDLFELFVKFYSIEPETQADTLQALPVQILCKIIEKNVFIDKEIVISFRIVEKLNNKKSDKDIDCFAELINKKEGILNYPLYKAISEDIYKEVRTKLNDDQKARWDNLADQKAESSLSLNS